MEIRSKYFSLFKTVLHSQSRCEGSDTETRETPAPPCKGEEEENVYGHMSGEAESLEDQGEMVGGYEHGQEISGRKAGDSEEPKEEDYPNEEGGKEEGEAEGEAEAEGEGEGAPPSEEAEGDGEGEEISGSMEGGSDEHQDYDEDPIEMVFSMFY